MFVNPLWIVFTTWYVPFCDEKRTWKYLSGKSTFTRRFWKTVSCYKIITMQAPVFVIQSQQETVPNMATVSSWLNILFSSSNVTGHHRRPTRKLQERRHWNAHHVVIIFHHPVRFLCTMRIFEVRALSSSPRLPLNSVSVAASIAELAHGEKSITQSLITQLIWCPRNRSLYFRITIYITSYGKTNKNIPAVPNIRFEFLYSRIIYLFEHLYLHTKVSNSNSNNVKLHISNFCKTYDWKQWLSSNFHSLVP